MPSFTTVLEDTSPMLVYSPNWRAGTSETDNLADQYSLSSFTLTQTKGASMTFSFYGSSIGIFGARRSNHGSYSVQLDGNPSAPFTGQSGTALFKQVMFNSSMSTGLHNLTVINGDNTFFDIDYVAFQTSVGRDDESLIVNTFQDTHPSFTYTPPSLWKTPDNVGAFSGRSGHVTTAPSTTATFTFQGDAVELYGPVGPNGTAAYSVQMDSHSPSLFSANKQFYRPQELLFYAGNLGAGQHSLQIQLGSTASGEFAIDYANVYTTASLGGSVLAMTPGVTSRMPPGAVAGLAITTTLAILASLLCIYLFWRQRYELLHYAPPPNPKVPVADAGFVRPFVMSPAMERNLAPPRVPRSQAYTRDHARTVSQTSFSQGFNLTSVYSSTAPPSTVASAPSGEDMYTNGPSSHRSSRVPRSRNIQEEIRPAVPEKSGLDLSQGHGTQQPHDDQGSPNNPYDGIILDPDRPPHPPPEYSRNPNRNSDEA